MSLLLLYVTAEATACTEVRGLCVLCALCGWTRRLNVCYCTLSGKRVYAAARTDCARGASLRLWTDGSAEPHWGEPIFHERSPRACLTEDVHKPTEDFDAYLDYLHKSSFVIHAR
jgi:hypothetical protein